MLIEEYERAMVYDLWRLLEYGQETRVRSGQILARM